jgi:hypothetical protein
VIISFLTIARFSKGQRSRTAPAIAVMRRTSRMSGQWSSQNALLYRPKRRKDARCGIESESDW